MRNSFTKEKFKILSNLFNFIYYLKNNKRNYMILGESNFDDL